MDSRQEKQSYRVGFITAGISVFIFGISSGARAEVFQIVSSKSCREASGGSFSQCEFPKIELQETRQHILPLPYETLAKVRRTRQCRLDATNAALQVSLNRHGENGGSFLNYENLSVDHNRRRVLTHPRSYPFGNISIYPKVEQIFKSTRFPEGCEIAIEVRLNRLAIKSRLQAEEHMRSLSQQLESLKAYLSGLAELKKERERKGTHASIIEEVETFFSNFNHSVPFEDLQRRWQSILATFRATLFTLTQSGYRMESLDVLAEQLKKFTESLERVVSTGASSPKDVEELLAKINLEMRKNSDASIRSFSLDDHLQLLTQKLKDTESEIQLVENYLNNLFPETSESLPLEEEFQEAFDDEIEGPHGFADEYFFRLNQLGR